MAIYDETNTEDIAEFDGDDPLDDLRYFCKGAKQFIRGEIGNMDAVIARNNVIAEMQQSGDMTKFYRQMENLERHPVIANCEAVAMSRRSRFGRRRFH